MADVDKTPYALARAEFTESAEGRKARDPSTLGTWPDIVRFLNNRIDYAFTRGWTMGQDSKQKEMEAELVRLRSELHAAHNQVHLINSRAAFSKEETNVEEVKDKLFPPESTNQKKK